MTRRAMVRPRADPGVAGREERLGRARGGFGRKPVAAVADLDDELGPPVGGGGGVERHAGGGARRWTIAGR